MSQYTKIYSFTSGTQAEIIPLAIPDHFAIRAHHVVASSAYIVQQGQRRRWYCTRCSHSAKNGYDMAVHAVGAHLHQPLRSHSVVALPLRQMTPPQSARVDVFDPYLALARREAVPSGAVSLSTLQSWLTVKQLPGINHPRTLPSWCRCALFAFLAHSLVA